MKSLPPFLVLACSMWMAATVHAQELPCPELPFIRGLSVYGGDDESALPVIAMPDTASKQMRSSLPRYITIRFDVDELAPPRLMLRFKHCDKDWRMDDTPIVRDDFFTFTRSLLFEGAPAGANGFRWRFTNSFPSPEHPFVRFLYSGNWMFEVVDEQDTSAVYASGRFIVVEPRCASTMRVINDYWTRNDPPRDQVHRLELQVKIPESIFADNVRVVDFYRNHALYDNYRVDSYDRQANTFVEGIGLREKTFIYRNVLPVNGYRVFDLRSAAVYSEDRVATRFGGPDFTRYRFSTDASLSYGGMRSAALNSFDAEYLCVEFELEHARFKGADVFVAGKFNEWDPQPADRMRYDESTGHYHLHRYLLRGAYDYQYVVGNYDPSVGFVADADWVAIEGNSWSARNMYWTVVYYDDDQFGGITRAVGFARMVSGQ